MKTNLTKNLVLALILSVGPSMILTPVPSLGSNSTLSSNFVPLAPAKSILSLKTEVRNARKECETLDCAHLDLILSKVNREHELPESLERQLIARAISTAENHWPDTILEGPYETDFNIRVNQIEKLTRDRKTIGYRLIVSAKAWEIDSCEYDPISQPDLNRCPPGHIVEALFISSDLKEVFVDDKFYADFIPAKENL